MEKEMSEKYEIIDQEQWERKEHFHFFRKRRQSNYGVTVPLDISPVIKYRKCEKMAGRAWPLSTMLYFLAMKAVHCVPELCLRVVNGEPVKCIKVHPAFTYIPKEKMLHSNCVAAYASDFGLFAKNVEEERVLRDMHPTLYPQGGEGQNLIYLTVVNNISFTALSNPWGDTLVDTVPRIAFGKIEKVDEKSILPLSIEVLHELVDGVHISKFYEEFSRFVQDAKNTFLITPTKNG